MTYGQTYVQRLTRSIDDAAMFDVMTEAGSRLQGVYLDKARQEAAPRRREYWIHEAARVDELRRGVVFGDRDSMNHLAQVWSSAYESFKG